MVGTVLKGDLQSSIEDQLQQYARGIGSAAGGAASAVQQVPQAVGDTWEDLQRAGRTSTQDVQAQLADYATQAYNASQEAQRQAQEEAQRRAEQAAQVEQELTAHANQALAGAQQQAPQAGAPAQAALPHSEEPGTATDVGASDLGKNWKTQFDFGATYTGDYRTGTPHRGVDLVPSSGKGIGTEVDAFTPGTVTNVFRDPGAGGLMVYVQDADGLTHAYMHLAGSNVKVGDRVQRGQPIAQMGESGTEGSPHLHYEVRKNASTGDPLNQLIDPRPYLNGTKQPGGGGPIQAAQQAVGGAVQGARDAITGATQRTAEPLPQSAFEWKVNGGQSLNRDQVVQAGQQVGLSPDEAGYLYDSGVRNNVDAASALAIIKLEGNARNPNNNMFDISNAAYGGRAVPGSRWGQYDSKQQAIDAYYQLINKEYIPNGQDTIGTIMHGPASGPSTSTSHAYAPISENRPSYPQEVLDQVKQWGGQAQEAVSGAVGAAQGAVGGVVAGARRATGDVIQAGEQAATAARAPIYGTLAGGRDQAVQQLNVLQSQIDSLRDQLAGAPQGARQAIAGAAEPLIAGAQQTAQDVAGSRAGDLVLRSGRTPQEEAGYRQRQLDEVNRLATEQRTAPPPEITPGAVLGGAARLAIENPPSAGPSLEEYRQRQTQVGQAIEQQNPLRDVPFVGGLTSQAAQFGASGQWLIPFGAVTRTGEEVLAAAGVARPLLQRVGGEALSNALQNALYEVTTRTDATPQSVGEAFISGGALGGLMPLGAAGVTRIGQEILTRAPELTPLLRTRQRGEVDLGLITTGEPTPRPGEAPAARPVAGRQRLPNYDPNTPEGRFEAVVRPLRESSPDGLLHLDLNTLPENVLPLDRTTPTSSATGLIRTNPGGAPHTDDLRALYEANTQKRDFYADQSDQGVPTVGPDNLEEWFALNAITSQKTNVTGQVSEAIKVMGMVRKIARDGRAEGLSSPEIKANILKAVNDYTWSGPSGTNKRIGANKGYATGVSETGGIKTPTFAGNYGSAESRLYDPGITNDIHNWRAMNVDSTQVPAIREGKQYLDTPHESSAANNKTLYRGTEAVFNELGAEQGVDGYAFQSAVWDGIRNMQDGAPAAWKKWQAGDFQGAIRDAQAAGVFNRAKGVTGAPEPGEISRAMNQPGVKSALAQWGPYLKDPIPPELGISSVSRVYPGEMSKGKAGGPKRGAETLRPASLAFRQGERAVAESYAPVVGGLPSDALARLGVDERGVMPWLAASHRVVEQAPGDYVVHLPAGNADTARYVAATIGDALGAAEMPIHYPDYRAPDIAGLKLVADEATVRRAQQALADDGHASIRGPTGRSLQVPLHDPESAARIVTTLQRSGIDPATLSDYTGSNERISADAYPRYLAETRTRFEPTTAERRGLLERARGTAAEGGAATGPGATAGRQPGQANVPFATNLGGAAFGGYAGNLATPSDATPEERARNIAAGAAAGFGGTHLITRGLDRRLAPEVVGRPTLEAQLAARPAEGFRAPGRPEGAELRATTQEPPGGPAGRAPRTFGEVHSNPHLLEEARAGQTPLSDEELAAHYEQLDTRYQQVQARLDAVDEMLRNPNQKVERPPWSAGLTNLQVAELARRADISPYEPLWWEKVGMESGSGEVRDALREGGAFSAGQSQRELAPAELRAERNTLATEQRDIQAAADQLGSAPAGTRFARPAQAPEARGRPDLPFDTGAPPDQAAPLHEAQGGLDEGARLAQEVVLSKGRGTLRSDAGTVSLTGDVGGAALVSHEAVQRATEPPPSARTVANMPNLDSMLEGEMPEIAAQIRKAAEDHPDLIEKYRQGVISQDSLKNDLATRVGMSFQDWLKTPVGKGFNPEELVALQAAAIEAQGRAQDMGMEVIARGGVDALTPEELAFSAATLADATRVLAVARGGRTTAGRTLNALKNRFDRTMASGITASNERIAANRLTQQARRAAVRATTVLNKGRALDLEATTAKAEATRNGAPRNILAEIDRAYGELDRYNAMTLHEKGADFDRLKAERAKRAADRKAAARGAPEELLSALRQELRAEQDNFAKRKDTWETMAFWDSKAFENAMTKRTAFRGQLYIEQQRKLANIAAKGAEKDAARAFDDELKGRTKQTEKATRVLEAIGGQEVTRDLLRNYIATLNDPSPDATAKFLKGIAKQSSWGRANIVRIAGLVSAPITHAINVGGNTTIAMVERLAVRPLTVAIDAMRSGITGGERQAYAGELLPALQASGSGAVGSLPKVIRALRTGINPYEAENLNLARVRPGFNSGTIGLGIGRGLERAGAAGAVDAAVEMPLRALTAEDVMFREMALAYHGQRVAMREALREGFSGDAAKGRANSILKNLEDYPELTQEVDDASRREVFQERRNLPLMRGGASEANMALVESQVLPFVRTPANITAQGIAMSPAGFGGALQAARGVRDMPVGTRAERYTRGRQVLLAEERAARATIGTGILAAGVWWGAQGRLTADYPQDEQARSALPQGWRPWSFIVDDPITKNTYYVPLQNLGPVGVPLAMAAIATDPTHRGKSIADPEEWGQAAMGVGRYVLDSTYLQGLSDFVDMLQDPRANASKFAEPLVASYGPYSSLFRELQRTAGVAGRNPREGFRGLLDAMLANYPGTSGTVPPARTPLGDERTQGATGAGRLVPFRYDIQRDEPTLKILRETGIGVPKPPKAIGLRGGSIELTEDERTQLQQMRGQAIRDMVPRVTQNPAAVQKAVDLATTSATRAFLAQMGADDVRKRWTAKQAPEPYYLDTAAS